MKKHFAALAAISTMFAAVAVVKEINAHSAQNGILEQKVNANLIRIRIKGHWQELPLMPLSSRHCESGDAHFERYCE